MTAIVFPHSDTDWLLTPENTKLAIKDLLEVIVVDRTYDIPYVAGYSQDGSRIYIDRSLEMFPHEGVPFDVAPFLILHEITEKAILELMTRHGADVRGKYMIAHQIAMLAESGAVKEEGLDLEAYNKFFDKQIKKIGKKKPEKVPRDLDLTPYQDEKDFDLLKQMIDIGMQIT